jgi:hypothetical protein
MTQLFVAAHKPISLVPEGYKPVQAGAHGKQHFLPLVDDSGENISERNASYCEITVLYWIWKNIRADRIGLVHYRRFFAKSAWASNIGDVYSISDINEMLSTNDILVPKSEPNFESNWDNYARFHHIQDMEILREYIVGSVPQSLVAFDHVMGETSLHRYNMFATSWVLFDSYMTWLMPILDYCYEAIDTSTYSQYDKRLIGFLAERLFNVWLYQNNHLTCRELSVSKIDTPLNRRIYETARDGIKGVLFSCRLLGNRKKG